MMNDAMNRNMKEEPGRSERAAAWQTAIGLQAADRISTSDYLRQTSMKHVNGQISLEQVNQLLYRYYFEMNAQEAGDPETEEADKVALNIVRILTSETLDFTPEGLASLHRQIYEGVYENAGKQRVADVSKREWVLGGDTVSFLGLETLPGALEQIIAQEKQYRYEDATSDELISHLSSFISELWEICAFGEGNTRFTGVFTLLYLRYLGISIKFNTFTNDSWYFHNALVRANFRDLVKNIEPQTIYLERFFRNLILGEQWDLRNRYIHVRPAAEWSVQSNMNASTSTVQVQVKDETIKVEENSKSNTRKVKENSKKEQRKDKENSKKPEEREKSTAEKERATEEKEKSRIVTKKPAEEKKSAPSGENSLDNPNLLFLAAVIGEQFLSVKEMMAGLGLKGRENFLKLYLTPALQQGIVCLLYPRAPRHPRQKYLLTKKGMDYLAQTGPEMVARVRQHLTGNKI